MHHLFESGSEVAAHALRRRERVVELRVLGLERLQLLEQHVEVAVGDFGCVLYVIEVVVAVEFAPEFLDSLFRDGVHGREVSQGVAVGDVP